MSIKCQGQAVKQYFVHILLLVTDNCPSESAEGETKVCGRTGIEPETSGF